MDYDRVIEIAFGILIALAIGWVLLKYGSVILISIAIVLLFVYIAVLVLRILRG